jgi:membrane protein DedA with SNARE-associated domain
MHILKMVNWSFWNGFEYNDNWSLGYYMKEKAIISEPVAYVLLGIIGIACLICLIWMWKKEKKKSLNY